MNHNHSRCRILCFNSTVTNAFVYWSQGCGAIIAAAKANTTVSDIIEIGKCWYDKYSGYTLGSRGDIVNAFAKPILKSLIEFKVLGALTVFTSLFKSSDSI